MQLTLATIIALTGLAAAAPNPFEKRTGTNPTGQIARMTFRGGPASYTLDIPANGQIIPTNNEMSVSIIDTPDFNAFYQCTFYSAGEKALVQTFTDGVQGIVVGPPQPITGVRCEGTCIYNYNDCVINGQYVGTCCSGYCAGNKCRPWY